VTALLFATTLCASAGLLFAVQPMAGKALLPLAGGTPAVWNTCLVFFQTTLLLGYLYADRLVRLSFRGQLLCHLVVADLAVAAAVSLRPDPGWIPVESEYPIPGLLAYLAAGVGLPVFVLSATAPLLQRWFAAGKRDPYALYAASNAGSLTGLLAYPFLIEPASSLGTQERVWVVGFVAVVGLIAVCGFIRLPTSGLVEVETSNETERSEVVPPPTRRQILTWVGLAALPSSLLMGTTAHLTRDVAPIPLLWVVPLALYLLSFIIVFARWPERARQLTGRVAPMFLVFLVVTLATGATEPITLVASVLLAALFAVALLCHGELVARRPAETNLTTFYLAVSVGGVLGGLFNAVIAPLVFSRLGTVEYPLAVVVAALVRPGAPWQFHRKDAFLLSGFTLLTVGLSVAVPRFVEMPANPSDPDALGLRLVRAGLMYGLPAVVAFALVRNPIRFAGCLAVLLLAGSFDSASHGRTLYVTRNFFGTLHVTQSADGQFIRLVHGTTQHGQQRIGDPKPLMYYHPAGPVGRLFEKLPAERTRRVAVVGLGCGAMAAYAQPGQEWTFFEIDPAVVRLARDDRFFTFLRDCRVEPRIVLGDARRQLAREPDGAFDLIVLDAFSSDAIPVHLLTTEAFALYGRKLAPGGVLAFHLSNRYLDLPPLVARVGAKHEPPFAAKVDADEPTEREREDGKFASTWVVLARDPADLGPVAKDPHWQTVRPTDGPVWRDDFSNLLAVWKKSVDD
jgi:protein-L-isoaspartate O-methyltransferase